MQKQHYIVIILACIVGIGLFIFADTVAKPKTPSANAMPSQMPAATESVAAYDFGAYLDKVYKNFSKDSIALISSLIKDESPENLNKLIAIFHQKEESVAEAYFTQKLGNSTKDPAKLTRAAELFEATSQLTTDEKLHHFLADNAVSSYAAANNLAPNDSNLLKLAVAYMNQGTNPMQGVTMLLDLVKKDSTNAEAQFMLGKFGIVSKQYDKALIRLEKVLYLQPQNTEALFLAGMANKELGNKEKAKALLTKCAAAVDNPALRTEIEQYIKDIK